MTELNLIIPGLAEVPESLVRGRRRLAAVLSRSQVHRLAPGEFAALRAAIGLHGAEAPFREHGPVCALGEGLRAEGWACLAEPVALHAHTDHVVVGHPDALGLDMAEAQALAQSVRSLLAADDVRVAVAHPLRWYLVGEGATGLAAGLAAAADVAGGRMDTALDAGGTHGSTMALLTEIQMLFHAHPVNENRQLRGLPAVQGAWLSGGGAPCASAWSEAPRLFSEHPYVRGLAMLAGQQPGAPPRFEDLTSPAGSHRAPARAVVALPALPLAGEPAALEQALERLEAQWIRPAWRALGRGTLSALCWWDAAGRGGRLSARDRWRFWARRPA